MSKQKTTVRNQSAAGHWVKKDSMAGVFLSSEMQAIANDRDKSIAFLQKAGIVTKHGNLAGPFKGKAKGAV
jgi:hypothetical protein